MLRAARGLLGADLVIYTHPMASWEGPRETLERIHPEQCGTPNGYLQISRARKALLKRDGSTIDGLPLPEYDDACKLAWKGYIKRRRQAGGKLNLRMGPPPIADAPHGTQQRFRIHVKERRTLRAKGVPESELPPICPACKDAWRIYNAKLKEERQKAGYDRRRGSVRSKPGANPVEVPSPWSSCGTPDGIREHGLQRKREREQGLPLTPFCSKCQAEKLRGRVLRRISKVRARKS